MTETIHLPCPDEQECGSSDAYSFNGTKGQGYCHACELKTWLHNDEIWAKRGSGKGYKLFLTDNGHSVPRTDETHFIPKDIKEPTGGTFVGIRGITSSTMEKFNVKTDGDKQHYVYPSGGVKTRYISTKDFSASNLRSDELFGMNLFPVNASRIVTITEGEVDTMSAWQMLSQGSTYTNPVVSLPSATPSGKLWEKCKGWLDSFEKIILSVDNDTAGAKVAETMFDLFPTKVYMMDHGSHKDANDFLQSGDQKAYKSAWWGAKKYTPAGFTVGVDAWKKAILEDNPYEYVPTHIEAYNLGGRGWIKGGTTILKAPPGTGKTSLFRGIQHDLVMKKGQKVAVLHMEEIDGLTGRGMATYELGLNVNTKEDQDKNGIDTDKLLGTIERIVVDENGVDRFMAFTIDPMDPIKSCLQQAKYAISAFGVDYVFIDHLQKLAYMAGTSTATEELTSLIVNLNELCVRKSVGIICISHVNEDGKAKYAKSIEEEAYVIVEMVRDKKADDFQERNTTYLSIDKNRPFAYTGDAGALMYDPVTTMVTERLGPREPVTENTNDF